ncbi:hypothetical protein [Enterococcus larvae]|uniref:hypothetical protein n=1 Tax=Enterococcus larvae TaxID=2794352 RepID=UPI003F2BA809
MIKDIEGFWEAIDKVRQEKGMNWVDLVGGNTKLAKEKRLNLSLRNILKIQEILGINILSILPYGTFEPAVKVVKNPETTNKMNQIYELTKSDNWMANEETVQRVQEIGRTII